MKTDSTIRTELPFHDIWLDILFAHDVRGRLQAATVLENVKLDLQLARLRWTFWACKENLTVVDRGKLPDLLFGENSPIY